MIRPYRGRDFKVVLAFQCDLFATNFPDFQCSNHFLHQQAKAIRRAARQRFDNALFVYEQEGEVVGFLWLAIRLYDGRSIGNVDQIYLLPKARGLGLGNELMAFAEKYFTNIGIYRLRLSVTVANQVALHLYQAKGFVPIRMEMEKPIG